MPVPHRPPTLAELRLHRDAILRIASEHGAARVRVFGSVARGDAVPSSDIDLVVELDPGRGALDVSELILDLQHELRRKVDVIALRDGTRPPVSLERQAVPL